MAQGEGAASGLRADDRPPGRLAPNRHAAPPGGIRTRLAPCPEIDCLRHRFPPALLAAAELRAIEAGIGAQDALIAAGQITAHDYAAALAHWLGLRFDDLRRIGRHDCPLNDREILAAAAAGVLPLSRDGVPGYAMAPAGLVARRIVKTVAALPSIRERLVLTSRDALTHFAAHHARAAWAYEAAFALKERTPSLSAATRCRGCRWIAGAAGVAALAGLAFATDWTLLAAECVLGLVFFHWIALRIGASLHSAPMRPLDSPAADRDLPVYTIVAALYREAAALPGLIDALNALDYPREKLDIKIVLEADDRETRRAFEQLDPGAPFELVLAPKAGPRTKPKALNAALPFARGSLVAVYDAEDRPEPDQLRRADLAFRQGDGHLACVQARLTIDNSADSWLTRLYTAEYAGLFDAFLPGIARWRLPLPLGGSSNHFRMSVLRRIGAWDPFNVTEDADLGMRLARQSYVTAVIDSSTYEEAPAHFGPWLRQRTRWFKGWLKTWQVHMRRPLRLLRELGLVNFIVFQLVVGGSVLAALVHPLFVFAFAATIATSERPLSEDVVAWIYGGTFLAGYATSAAVGTIGLAHRGLSRQAWWLILTPFYWWCLSAAAWRAVWQVLRDPYRWEKTEHGLARTSRRGGF